MAASTLRSGARLLRGGVASAFSLGPGYEPQPLNRKAGDTGADHYYLDLRAKATPHVRPLVTGHGELVAPTATAFAQSALGWWERHLGGDPEARPRFLERARELVAAGERLDAGLAWRYELNVPKYGIEGSWYSAMAQGQAASVLVRANAVTREDAHAEAAVAAVRAMTDLGERLGVAVPTAAGIAYEECPSDPPSLILNGWIFALWGLYDVATALGDDASGQAFEAGARTLASTIDQYDTGWWSKYSLFTGRGVDLAKPTYHAGPRRSTRGHAPPHRDRLVPARIAVVAPPRRGAKPGPGGRPQDPRRAGREAQSSLVRSAGDGAGCTPPAASGARRA